MGISLTIWQDESQDLVDRLDVMGTNARSGMLLVLLVLAMFLKFRLALWVAAGIPIALMGTVMMFPVLGMSISTLSVMGIILVLGILVDDAIVVGERVYSHEQLGKSPVQAAVDGTPPAQMAGRWRELTGSVPDAVELTFTADAFAAGKAIDIQLRGSDQEELKAAAAQVRHALQGYDGVFDIADSYRGGKQEVKLVMLPEARNLGLSSIDLARQVRQAFYGEEVQRIQRGREDMKVMVRFPESERRSLGDLEDMRIRSADGRELPFSSVAEVELGAGFSSIAREDGRRVIRVMADVDRTMISPEEILSSLETTVLADLEKQYPGIDYGLAGEAEEASQAMSALMFTSAMALLIIYALLAIPLKSYLQPFVIMSVIPFGFMGAIIGHFILGWNLIFFSLLGIVALSGVVVNSSLVLVDYINRRRREGVSLLEAVGSAGVARFRPIVLTSVTTFVGLIPLIATSNLATMVFTPMAISLAFGVLFATVITLFLVPCFYLILEDAIALPSIFRRHLSDNSPEPSDPATTGE